MMNRKDKMADILEALMDEGSDLPIQARMLKSMEESHAREGARMERMMERQQVFMDRMLDRTLTIMSESARRVDNMERGRTIEGAPPSAGFGPNNATTGAGGRSFDGDDVELEAVPEEEVLANLYGRMATPHGPAPMVG